MKKIFIILLITVAAFLTHGTTYTTIAIDGTNDFESDEDVSGTSSTTYYITWDASYIYLGAQNDNIDDNNPTKWVFFYIDSDPQPLPTNGSGTTTGITYNTQQPNLPFTANYHFRWKNNNTYHNLQQYNGNSWTDGTQTNIQAYQSGTFVEFKIPRANIGSPTQIYITGAMINEVGEGEWTYYITPTNNNGEGKDVDLHSYFGFNLTSGVSPDNSVHINASLPVELTSFLALARKSFVALNWQTATEVNNYGFEIEKRQISDVKIETWKSIGFVNGHGNSNSPKNYSFIDEDVLNGKYFYRLKQIDNDGKYEYSKEVEVNVESVPTEFGLFQNYPNPFNPSTTIKYALPNKEFVQLKVFNILGNEIANLVNGVQEAGSYKVEFNLTNIKNPTSGIYFYRLETGSFVESRKMTLLK